MGREAVLTGGGAESRRRVRSMPSSVRSADRAPVGGAGVAFIQLIDRDARACRCSPETFRVAQQDL